MHQKLLKGIGRDLEELKSLDHKKYLLIEKKLGRISEESDLAVHRSLKKMRRVS